MENKIGAIVLAGGKSSSIKTDKGLTMLNNKPLVGYAIAAVLPICADVIISTNNPNYEQFGFQLVADEHSEIGPIDGLYAALKASKYHTNIVISCDTPFVSTEILEKMAKAGFDNCALLDGEKNIHPLIGLYTKEILIQIELQIAKGEYKLIDLLEQINCQLYTPSIALQKKYPNLCFNVNTPETLDKAEELMTR